MLQNFATRMSGNLRRIRMDSTEHSMYRGVTRCLRSVMGKFRLAAGAPFGVTSKPAEYRAEVIRAGPYALVRS